MGVILYTKIGCPWSQEVKDFFHKNNIQFEEREVTENKSYYDELVIKSGMAKSPTLDINGEILADTDVDEVRRFFQSKRLT